MSKLDFTKTIPENLGKSIGVQSLSDRPNKISAYGEGGLTASQLKQKFDQYADALAEAVSELQTKLNGDEAGKYIGISIGNEPNKLESLYDLIEAIKSGDLADKFLKVTPSPDATEKTTISGAFGIVSQEISNITEKINNIKVDLSLTEDYQLTVSVKINNDVISTSEPIDLPIETLFKSARYDSDNKKLIFTTDSGSVEVGISDIVSGLVTTDQLSAAVSEEKIKEAVTELFSFSEDEEY